MMIKNWMVLMLLTGFILSCQSESKQQREETTEEKSVSDGVENGQQQALNQAKKDEKAILQYLEAKSIDAERTNSGLYYKIIDPGNTNKKPSKSSQVSVQYVGKLLDGTSFDRSPSDENITFPLNKVIMGWQEGIPKVGEGGEVKLIIPSHLGYGNAKVGRIPSNSVLVFDVKLLEVRG